MATKRKEIAVKKKVAAKGKAGMVTKGKRMPPGKKAGEIAIETEYEDMMAEIDRLLIAGNGTIREGDLPKYSRLARAAQAHEQSVYKIPAPKTLEGLLEWKMFELKMKQKELAIKLNVSDAKLSLVMSGKQKPDVILLKSIHDRLGIDGNVLLSLVG